MRHIADRFVVVLDANVLFPFRKRDVLLRFYHAGLFRARWSDQILDEWTRSLLRIRPDLADSIQSQLAAMRREFPEARVTGHESLIAGLQLPDPDDRHVLATAILCGAQHIVTDNLADFPDSVLGQYSIQAIEADEFLSRTFELYTPEAIEVLKSMRQAYKNPSFCQAEFVLDLTAKGLPRLASHLRPLRSFL